jgi:DNA-binding NarL/FixJ family response regulator
MDRVRVDIRAEDPITLAGVVSSLQSRPEVQVLAGPHERADVRVFVADRVTSEVITELRTLLAENAASTVLVTNELNHSDLLTVVECQVVAVLPQAGATGARLAKTVLAAAKGAAIMPPDLVGELLKRIGQVQREVLAPRGLNASGLSDRERDVLRLMADGRDTAEIAEQLCYSERTVKNVISGMTTRLNLRNRSHAVAYAVRAGVI